MHEDTRLAAPIPLLNVIAGPNNACMLTNIMLDASEITLEALAAREFTKEIAAAPSK